jgi:hypothetical protein
MEHAGEPSKRYYLESVLGKLLENGWISEFVFDDQSESFAVHWTVKGRERSRWVKTIASELALGPKGMAALLTICEELSGPES